MKIPDIKTPLPGPIAQKIIEKDKKYLSTGVIRSYPLVAARGEGAMLEDIDGNRFLDFSAGIAVTSTGHCHPEVVSAIQEQAAKLIHVAGTVTYHEPYADLAEKIAEISPISSDKRVYFGNSGTEAMEAALKLARYATGRSNFISFFGGFHGRTMGALSVTASKPVQKKGFGNLVPGAHFAHYAYCYRCPFAKEPRTCGLECLNSIEDLFKRTLPPEEVAAFVLETMQGESGVIVPPEKFHKAVREMADKFGILVILDEIQVSMGRTGKMFACEHYGIEPDIICIAKGIASGMPIGVTVSRADLMNWPAGAHASTFGGNPVSCAAALVSIKLIEEEFRANAEKTGSYLLEKLSSFADKYPLIGEVRGKGLFIGIELVSNRTTKEKAVRERGAILQSAFRKGLLLMGAGESCLRLVPPLCVTIEQADTALDILDSTFAEIRS